MSLFLQSSDSWIELSHITTLLWLVFNYCKQHMVIYYWQKWKWFAHTSFLDSFPNSRPPFLSFLWKAISFVNTAVLLLMCYLNVFISLWEIFNLFCFSCGRCNLYDSVYVCVNIMLLKSFPPFVPCICCPHWFIFVCFMF